MIKFPSALDALPKKEAPAENLGSSDPVPVRASERPVPTAEKLGITTMDDIVDNTVSLFHAWCPHHVRVTDGTTIECVKCHKVLGPYSVLEAHRITHHN